MSLYNRNSCGVGGFTLIELLSVLAIVVLIAVFAIPSTTSVMEGSQLNQATEVLAGKLQSARLTALSRNAPVEVRFYKYRDSNVPGGALSIRAFQALLLNADGSAAALDKPYKMSASVGICVDDTLTTFLDSSSGRTVLNGKLENASWGFPKDTEYIGFRFRPDGSTDLAPATEKWFLTVANLRDANSQSYGAQNPPANYATIQVDPVNGGLRVFRPGVK